MHAGDIPSRRILGVAAVADFHPAPGPEQCKPAHERRRQHRAQHGGGAAFKADRHRQRIAVLEIAAQLREPRPDADRPAEQRDRRSTMWMPVADSGPVGLSALDKRQLSRGSFRNLSWLKLPSSSSGWPNSPDANRLRMSMTAGSKRRSWPMPSWTPAFSRPRSPSRHRRRSCTAAFHRTHGAPSGRRQRSVPHGAAAACKGSRPRHRHSPARPRTAARLRCRALPPRPAPGRSGSTPSTGAITVLFGERLEDGLSPPSQTNDGGLDHALTPIRISTFRRGTSRRSRSRSSARRHHGR